MNAPNHADSRQAKGDEKTSVFGIFLRLFWMLLGNITLGISAVMIMGTRDRFFSTADLIYAVSIPLLVVARYLDIARYKGADAYGEPATLGHWKRYTAFLIPSSVGAWCVCHAVAYWLGR